MAAPNVSDLVNEIATGQRLAIAYFVLVTVATVMRTYARLVIVKHFRREDYTMIVAFVSGPQCHPPLHCPLLTLHSF